MPILDGYGACKQIQRFFDTEQRFFRLAKGKVQRPIICALSGFINDEIEEKCENIGFDLVF